MKKIFVTLMLAGLCASPVVSATLSFKTVVEFCKPQNGEMTLGRAAKMTGAAMVAGAATLGGLELLRRGVVAGAGKVGQCYQGSYLQKGVNAANKFADRVIDSCANGLNRGASAIGRAVNKIPGSLTTGSRIGLMGALGYCMSYRRALRLDSLWNLDPDYGNAHNSGLFTAVVAGGAWAAIETLAYLDERAAKAKKAEAEKEKARLAAELDRQEEQRNAQ